MVSNKPEHCFQAGTVVGTNAEHIVLGNILHWNNRLGFRGDWAVPPFSACVCLETLIVSTLHNFFYTVLSCHGLWFAGTEVGPKAAWARVGTEFLPNPNSCWVIGALAVWA